MKHAPHDTTPNHRRHLYGFRVDFPTGMWFDIYMTNHSNSFASIYSNEVAKFASLGAEKAGIYAAKNVAERLGLSYTKVRELVGMIEA